MLTELLFLLIIVPIIFSNSSKSFSNRQYGSKIMNKYDNYYCKYLANYIQMIRLNE